MVERTKMHTEGIRRILSRFVAIMGIIMMNAAATSTEQIFFVTGIPRITGNVCILKTESPLISLISKKIVLVNIIKKKKKNRMPHTPVQFS